MSLRVLVLHRQASAVQYYRSTIPARILTRLGHDVTYDEKRVYQDWMRPKERCARELWPEKWLAEHLGKFDLLIVDRAVTNEEWRMFAAFRHHSEGCRMIVDFDDAFDIVPWWNPSQKDYHPGQTPYDSGFNHLRVSEMTTVSTEPLRERFEAHSHAIEHVPNFIDPKDWEGLQQSPLRALDAPLRICYGGASGHLADLDEARLGIEAVINNPPVPIRFICFGAIPHWLYELSKRFPGRIVRLPWASFEDYPQAIAWGGFDLAIAPLKDEPFNLCKSNIKWLEMGVQGIPMIVSDVGPYAAVPDGCAIKISNTPIQWAEALRNMLLDRSLRERIATQAHEAILDSFSLDRGQKTWESVIEKAMARPRIMTLEDTRLPARPGPPSPSSKAPQGGTSEVPVPSLVVEGSERARLSADPPGDSHH